MNSKHEDFFSIQIYTSALLAKSIVIWLFLFYLHLLDRLRVIWMWSWHFPFEKDHGVFKWYFTTPTVTLLNCSKFWSSVSHISSDFCTIFCKWVHCGGSTSGFATSATCTVVEFAKNSAKTTRKVTNTLLQNITTIW